MKVIERIELDLSPLPKSITVRPFSVIGDAGAVFNLEIKNEDNYYYNFTTLVFQATVTGLYDGEISKGGYSDTITFPAVTDADQYDISLSAQPLTCLLYTSDAADE